MLVAGVGISPFLIGRLFPCLLTRQLELAARDALSGTRMLRTLSKSLLPLLQGGERGDRIERARTRRDVGSSSVVDLALGAARQAARECLAHNALAIVLEAALVQVGQSRQH